MAEKIREGLNAILQSIENIVDSKIKNSKYDKTYRGKVIAKVEDNIYNIQVNGAEYNIKYSGILSENDIVMVKAPLNNFSDMYIENEKNNKFIKTIDSNGWTILNFDTYKEYTKQITLNISLAANSWNKDLYLLDLPSGMTSLGEDRTLTYSAFVNDGAIDINIGMAKEWSKIHVSCRNLYSGDISTVAYVQLRILEIL